METLSRYSADFEREFFILRLYLLSGLEQNKMSCQMKLKCSLDDNNDDDDADLHSQIVAFGTF